jgi:hypothetical protein
MNLQKVRQREIQIEAENLLLTIIDAYLLKKKAQVNTEMRGPSRDPQNKRWLKLAGPIGGQRSPKFAPDLQVIVNILRAHVLKRPFADCDMDSIHKILNKRVTRIRRFTTIGDYYLIPEGPRVRFAAEELLRYMQHSAENSVSGSIAVCPNCDGLFLIQRLGQKTCSDKCRFEEWRKNDPEYWKNRHPKWKKR